LRRCKGIKTNTKRKNRDLEAADVSHRNREMIRTIIDLALASPASLWAYANHVENHHSLRAGNLQLPLPQ
jgi:hypothetical protein